MLQKNLMNRNATNQKRVHKWNKQVSHINPPIEIYKQRLKICTMNAFASIPEPIRYNGLAQRAKVFGEAFYKSVGKDVDIICLQELVWEDQIILNSFTEHKFRTPIMRSSLFGSRIRLQHSGLCTLSKYPIQKIYATVFNGPAYHVEKLCAKGAILVQVNIPGLGYVNVVNIHLNAWSGERADKARDFQINQMIEWLYNLHLDPNQPLIVTGDWNIDAYEHSYMVKKIMEKLKSSIILPKTTQFSFDPKINPLVGLDAPDEYATVSKKGGCVQEYHAHGTCTCCPRQLVDLIAISDEHLTPQEKEVNVFEVKYHTEFPIQVKMGVERMITHVSDHNAVLLDSIFYLNAATKNKNLANIGGEHATSIVYDVPFIEIPWFSAQIVLTLFIGFCIYSLLSYLCEKYVKYKTMKIYQFYQRKEPIWSATKQRI